MSYDPTVWEDETPTSTPVKFRIRNSGGSIVEDNATIEVVTPVDAGTPLNATNLNKLENGVKNAHDLVALAQAAADAAQDDADQGVKCYEWRDEPIALQLNGNTPLTTNDKAHWMVTNDQKHINGVTLISVAASCVNGSSSGVVTITLKKYIRSTATWISVLTTNITIDAGELDTIEAAVSAVINEAQANFAVGDKILAECTASGTGVTHCQVHCVFRPIEV